MELIVNPKNLEHLKFLCTKDVQAFIIGNDVISNRLDANFSKEDIVYAIDFAHNSNKKVYVAMNAIYHNHMLETVTEYLKFLDTTNVDRVLFMDYGFFQIYKELGLNMELTYASDMMTTNYFLANYWYNFGVKRVQLANELNLEEVLEIKKHAKGEVEILGQGIYSMFQSVRPLVNRYLEYLKEDSVDVDHNRNLNMYDKERNLYYPIYQDQKGTHIMSGREMCVVDELDVLIENKIDAIRIDGFLQSEEYINNMVDLYSEAINTCKTDKSAYTTKKAYFFHRAEQIAKRPLDNGFFYKHTMYKVK